MEPVLYDQLPILTVVLSLLVMVVLLVRQRQRRLALECWFCNHIDIVDKDNSNSWTCSSCEQYNGFDSEGNYNKPIPELYEETHNKKPKASYKEFQASNQMKLCKVCFHSQQFKLQKRSNFTPNDPNNWEAEERQFVKDLEELHKLCRDCQKLAEDELVVNRHVVAAHKIGKRKTPADGRHLEAIREHSYRAVSRIFFDYVGVAVIAASVASEFCGWRSLDTTISVLSVWWIIAGLALRGSLYPTQSLDVGVPNLLVVALMGSYVVLRALPTAEHLPSITEASLAYYLLKTFRCVFLTMVHVKRYRTPFVPKMRVIQDIVAKKDKSQRGFRGDDDIDEIFAGVKITERKSWF